MQEKLVRHSSNCKSRVQGRYNSTAKTLLLYLFAATTQKKKRKKFRDQCVYHTTYTLAVNDTTYNPGPEVIIFFLAQLS